MYVCVYTCQNLPSSYRVVAWTILEQHCCHARATIYCWTNNIVHSCFNNIVEQWWSNNVLHGCWQQGKLVLIEQPCSLNVDMPVQLVNKFLQWIDWTMVIEQCCKNMAEQQRCSLFIKRWTNNTFFPASIVLGKNEQHHANIA